MPVTFNFDVEQASILDANDRTRIQVAFLRLGWEHIGGSAWRYPRIDADPISEDWMNHVIPALMYFRSLVEHSGMVVTKFSLDAHSEAAFKGGNPDIGPRIDAGGAIRMYDTGLAEDHAIKLSEDRLRKFIADAAASL